MQPVIFKKLLGLFSLLAITSLTTLAAPIRGGESFSIYLNDKLLLTQHVSQSLSVKSLGLDQAKPNDQLVVYYNHCGKIGKGRSIVIRDEEGRTVKEWKFANSSDTKGGMTIAVKELLQLQKKGGNLNLYYASDEMPKGRMLVAFDFAKKSNT